MTRLPSLIRSIATLALVLPLVACEPVSIAMLGIGANAGISHQMSGPACKTFTAPMVKVKTATRLALRRMGIQLKSVERTPTGETLYARTSDRDIEIEIEAVTPATTRIRAVARRDFLLVDAATALEIVTQTGKAMGV